MSDKKYSEFNLALASGTPVLDDTIIYSNPSTGVPKKVTLRNLNDAVGVIKVVKVTMTYADFARNAPTNQVDIWTRPANSIIHAVIPIVRELFGVTDSYLMSVGEFGDATFFTTELNMAADTHGYDLGDTILIPADLEGATPIKAYIAALGDLDTMTTGIVDVYIHYSILA